jgi:AP2-like factor (euAP2 lineage)
MANSRKRERCSSRFKGVTWHKQHRRWAAQICVDYQHRFLGYYDTEDAAAVAYNEAVVAAFGEFANLNILPKRLISRVGSPSR